VTAFDRDTAVRPLGGDRFEATVAEGWWTPRGPLGGYVMAILLRALTEAADDRDRPARSLTVNFLRSPAAGTIAIEATRERIGRSLTTISGRMIQQGKPIALALATFSAAWPGTRLSEAAMPVVAPPDGEPAGPDPGLPERRPPFSERLRMLPRFGPPLFSGADRGEVGGWLGLREPRETDALVVAVLADAWFPAPWPRLDRLLAAPTIEMSVYFRAPLPLPGSLLLGRFRSRHVEDGFFEEDGELWAPDGTLVAQSRQLGLLVEPR
jgi:acyl-CoA thioesterase